MEFGEGDGGIEATDLASLLHRFEEAVTPPATPVPIVSLPEIDPSPALSVPKTATISLLRCSGQLKVRPPKIVSAPSRSAISLLPLPASQNVRVTAPSVAQSPKIVIKASLPSRQHQVTSNTISQVTGTAFRVIPNAQGTTSLLVVKPNLSTDANTLPKQTSLLKTVPAKPLARSASAASLTAAPLNGPKKSKSSDILQSMLLDKSTCLNPGKGTVQPVRRHLCNVSVQQQAFNAELPESQPKSNILNKVFQPIHHLGLSKSLPSSPASSRPSSVTKEVDHDYCGNGGLKQQNSLINSKVDLNQNKEPAFSAQESRTLSSLDAELSKDIADQIELSGITSSPIKKTVDCDVLEDGEVMVDGDGNDSILSLVSSSIHVKADSDSQKFSGCSGSSNDNMSGNTVAFNLNGEDPSNGRRRGRRYRRRTELNTSPIREDETDFFDKIPAFYTTLAIPSKPTKTTIFASTTKSLGTTDHLELHHKKEEQVDSGLFDKVPAHRRCFTNTAKDVEVNSSFEIESQEGEHQETLEPMTSSLISSSSSTELHPDRQSPSRRSRPKQRRRRRHLSSCSGSSVGQHSHSRSVSRSRSRSAIRLKSCSPSPLRSVSAHSRSRSCSTCSSSSSGSGSCGSSCSGCSRSRSRSSSSCSSSGSSKSRSRSPQMKRDWQIRGDRAMPEGSPRRRRHHRSGSSRHRELRSVSPAERAGWRSRSRSHRKRSKTIQIDEKAEQKRKAREEEKLKAMEERRVVYVGKIPGSYTKRQLYKRFECFGEIKEVKLNFREHGDNYGFVTFSYACDAIAAKEKGNNLQGVPKFDLCFGGRRQFCPDQYADLDGNREIEEEYAPMSKSMTEELDYAALLKQHSSQRKKGNL